MPTVPLAVQTYTAIINQTGTAAPIPTVLHNTFPDDIIITWTREGIGRYTCHIAGVTTSNTVMFVSPRPNGPNLAYALLTDGGPLLWTYDDLLFNPTDGIQEMSILIIKYS